MTPSSTIHYTLPRFILKDPGLQLLGNPQKQRVVPGGIDQSKNHPRDHERRMTPPQDLSFRYQWDSVEATGPKTSERPAGAEAPGSDELMESPAPLGRTKGEAGMGLAG
jgi:hypothetical protein